MLQLVISILLAFGMKADVVDGKVVVNQEVIQKAEASDNFRELGGDPVLFDIVITDQVDPKSSN